MVRVEDPQQWTFLRFEKSLNPQKKYDAILSHKTKRTLKRVPFGELPYQHFRDKTGLYLYSFLDHHDLHRRKAWTARHEHNIDEKFSSAWFAKNYLW
jgi:hypothetical protein